MMWVRCTFPKMKDTEVMEYLGVILSEPYSVVVQYRFKGVMYRWVATEPSPSYWEKESG